MTYQKPRVERFGTFRELTQAADEQAPLFGFCTAERAREPWLPWPWERS